MIAEPSMPARRPSPGLSIELSSNNPFRNRAPSPAFPSPALHTPTSAGSRPMSRNPFLQTFEAEFNKQAQLIDMSVNVKESPKKATFSNSTEELFKSLTLDDSDKKRAPAQGQGPSPRSGAPSKTHRPSRSDEEEARDRRPRDDDEKRRRAPPRAPPRHGGSGSRPPPRGSPDRRERRRRRNSESSMVDKGSLDPNEERRRRERRREREERAKDGKDSKSRSTRVRKPHGLDIIDKLDVSGIYGPSMIHHDGPYDAVRPHRNRKKDQRAPMEAFPVNSANNALGGSGPVNDNIDLDQFHGRGAEGFADFAVAAKKRPELEGRSLTYGPKERADIVHGDMSHGLGTSTFLEGAPASRAAIAAREEEQQQQAMANGGLGRKKSIAQRFRGISQPRREFDGRPRIQSPGNGRSPSGPLTGGGSYAGNRNGESNPFFDNYDEAYERKGTAIKIAESENRIDPASPSSPSGRNGLTRSLTSDSVTSPRETKPSTEGGFLNRMKSLKGGRRPRPERPAA